MSDFVPNRFPKMNNSNYRVAFIGEAPGHDETLVGEPFVGASGRMLKAFMSKAGLQPDACFFGNICQHRPPANDITAFAWDSSEIQSGIEQLRKDLLEFKPWLVVMLGRTPLYAGFSRSDIGNVRGSMMMCDRVGSPFLGYKCMPTYHPAACLRMYEWVPLFGFDIQRAAQEGQTHFLSLPQRDITICRTLSDVINCLSDVFLHKPKCGTDIEGYVNDMQCIGIAQDPSRAFVIPFRGPNGDSFFDESSEMDVWKQLALYLEESGCPKVWQNGLYDRFILQYTYHIVCRGNTDDTMLEWHEKYCELPKGLDIMTSLLTKEPYYKSERKSDSWETKMVYCGKDACVTLECHNQITQRLNESATRHYHFNRDLLNPLLYMELRGISYDTKTASERRLSVLQDMYEAQALLDKETGFGHNLGTVEEGLRGVSDLMCYKRDGTTVRAGYESSHPRTCDLVRRLSDLSPAEHGELSTLLKRHNNVDSPKFTSYLYDKLRLPIHINKKTKQPTADYGALLRLYKKLELPFLGHAIAVRRHSTDAEMLGYSTDEDGRMRCSYNAVGTVTSRLSCSKSPTRSGYNMQTVQKKDRDLFLADPGYWMFQCDLSGADGWTVGAWSKHLGDSTMYDDLMFGIKPAWAVCLILRHGAGINQKSREEIKHLAKTTIDKDSTDYFMCKVGIWGTCYLMGVDLLGEIIFNESKGKIVMDRGEVKEFQDAVFVRYHGVYAWHRYSKSRIERADGKGVYLQTSNGAARRFFGRKEQMLGDYLAHEPQNNTTYATNLAALNLWRDKENSGTTFNGERNNDTRHPTGHTDISPIQMVVRCQRSLRIQPLHQVHDALIGQFRQEDTAWAINKIRSYFQNTLTIAHQDIVIPFEGAYGSSWGKLDSGII